MSGLSIRDWDAHELPISWGDLCRRVRSESLDERRDGLRILVEAYLEPIENKVRYFLEYSGIDPTPVVEAAIDRIISLMEQGKAHEEGMRYPPAWILKVVAWVCHEHRVHAEEEEDWNEEATNDPTMPMGGALADPEQQWVEIEAGLQMMRHKERLQDALAQLSVEQQQVVRLVLAGKKMEEIAVLVGIDSAAVCNRLSRARKTLRKRLVAIENTGEYAHE